MMHRDRLRPVWMIAALLAITPASLAQAQASLPGSFEVSDTGAATYTIPIAVPPGTAGMQPSLSLVYNSQGGNGLLGMGWSLSGLPAVTRCPKTIVQDGTAGGVNYDANDRFCLEGQRLIAISGTYGADQTEYRTEREGFSKIISYGSAGTGPAWFKVWTKSGQVMEFGNTADSRIEAQGKTTARLWGVNKISDTKGNTIEVTYAEDNPNGQYYPARIDYTGNASAGVNPYASVRFTYALRPDIAPLYEAGSQMQVTARLTNVKTYAGESLIHDYRLAYDTSASTQRSRITSVALCDADNACLPQTGFAWRTGGPAFTLSNSFTIGLGDGDDTATGQHHFVMDVNGDGRADLVVRDCCGGFIVLMSNGTSYDYVGSLITPYGDKNEITTGKRWFVMDVDGDGKSDLVIRDGTGFAVYLSNGTTFTYVGSLSTPFADKDESTTGQRWFVMDVNGDGKADLVIRDAGGFAIYLSNGTMFTYAAGLGPTPYGDKNEGTTGRRWFVMDVNGDGKDDFVIRDGVGYAVYLSNGVTFTYSGGVSTGLGDSDDSTTGRHFFTMDVNGDGRMDLVVRDCCGGFAVYISTGATFAYAGSVSTPFGDKNETTTGPRYFALDVSGDGKSDFVMRNLNQLSVYLSPGPAADLLAGVTSGLGAVTSITYKPSADGAVYTKGAGAAFPTIDLQGAIHIVSEVQTSDGIGGTYRSTYKYAGARAHVYGRGFLGFESVTAKDEQTLVEQVTTYLQAHPYTGLMASRVKKLGATTLNETVNTYGSNDLGGGRSFVYLQQSVEKSWELNGSLASQVTTSHQYDSYGNATQVAVSTPDGYSKTTTNTYTNDTLNWLLGRLARASVTSVTPN